MDRLLRDVLARWVLLVLLVLTVAGKLIWSSGEGPLAFVVNVALGVASGFSLYGLGLLGVVVAGRVRHRAPFTV